jgi:septum formation protein
MPKLVLASTSPWRKALLAQLGLEFEAVAPETPEPLELDGDPVEQAERFASEKAHAVARLRPDAIVVGADQVLEQDGRSYAKVETADEALEALRRLSGRTHALITAVTVLAPGRSEWRGREVSRLTMRPLSEAELAAYVATGEWEGCAGCYRLEGRGLGLFERIEGDHTNVLGLPVPLLLTHLRTLGVPLFGPAVRISP